MNVAPGASYEAVFSAAQSGLVGTVALALLDNAGATVEEFDTTDIVELEVDLVPTGIYAATRIAPYDAGQFTLVWSLDGTANPAQLSVEELVVTSSAPLGPASGDTYATVEELQLRLELVNPSAVQVEAMNRVLISAAGEINSEIARTDDLEPWMLALAAQVNLERAYEHWQQMNNAFGIVALGDLAVAYTARDSWDRHAAKLAPLKQGWGFA